MQNNCSEWVLPVVQEARRHESQIARLSLTSKDCTNLMPGEPPDDQARIKALTEESKILEEELIEVEAKNRLYTLLGERTRSASISLTPNQLDKSLSALPFLGQRRMLSSCQELLFGASALSHLMTRCSI